MVTNKFNRPPRHRWLAIIGIATILLYSACNQTDKSPAVAPAPSTNPADFSGTWSWSSDSSYFDLTLQIQGNKLEGYHEAGLMDGSRIDAVLPDEAPSVSGTISGNMANIAIRSGYSPDVNYQVNLTLTDADQAEWIVTVSMVGETWIPHKCLLRRQSAGTTVPVISNDDMVISAALNVKAEQERKIGYLGLASYKTELENGSTRTEAELWRDGNSLLHMLITCHDEFGKLESHYWFNQSGQPALVERTMLHINPDSGKLDGPVETTAWYFDDGSVACARDWHDTAIAIDSLDTRPVLDAITRDLNAIRNIGGEQ